MNTKQTAYHVDQRGATPKLLLVADARPNFMKIAPTALELDSRNGQNNPFSLTLLKCMGLRR